jgi:hypothetical protein
VCHLILGKDTPHRWTEARRFGIATNHYSLQPGL